MKYNCKVSTTRDRPIYRPTDIIGRYLTSNIGIGFKKIMSVCSLNYTNLKLFIPCKIIHHVRIRIIAFYASEPNILTAKLFTRACLESEINGCL